MKKSKRRLIAGISLIAVQAAITAIHAATGTLYLPNMSGLSAWYALPLAIYYLGYFMIGIVGVYVLILGIYDLKAKPEAVSLYSRKGFKKATTAAYPLAFGAFLPAQWQNGALLWLFNTSEIFLPKPKKIISVLFEDMLPQTDWSSVGAYTPKPDMMDNVVYTLRVSVIGLIIGSLIGYFIAVIASLFPTWGKGGLTIVSVFNAIPIVALAPIMMYWTKMLKISNDNGFKGIVSKVLVVTLCCMAAMSVNAYRGLTELKPFSEDLMTSYAAGKTTVLLKLRLPNSVPYIFTALKVSLPLSVIAAVVAEYFTDGEFACGVGRMIKDNINSSAFTTAWAYIVLACLIGIVLYLVLICVQGILLKKRR